MPGARPGELPPGFLGSALFGGAPASFSAAYPVIYAALAAIAIPVLRPLLGMGGVMVALLLGPLAHPEQIGEIDLGVSIFLLRFAGVAALAARSLAGRARGCSRPAAALCAGPGGAGIAGCAPLAFAALWSLYQADRRRLGLLLLGIGGVLALLFGLTPLGKMFYGALRYGAEQSQINSVAHGIQWRMSFGAEGLNPWAFELMRASFVLVAMWAGVLVFKAAFMADAADRRSDPGVCGAGAARHLSFRHSRSGSHRARAAAAWPLPACGRCRCCCRC